MQPQMTIRDHFAAAALTGLLTEGDNGSFSEESYVRGAYRWADAMLRERGNHQAALDSSPVTEPMPKEKRAEVSVTLTDAEREAIEYYMAHADGEGSIEDVQVLRGLLERLK